jgi:membrane protease YdiL (CAAX protease family)
MTWVRYAPLVTGTGPTLAGLLLAFYLDGLPGLRRLGIQLSPWSAGRAWPVLVACLLLPLAVIVLPVAILAAVGAVPAPSWPGPGYLYGAVIGGGFLEPGLFEEVGWRGFALPHLQRRYSALVSSLVIGVVWAFWHWPNFLIPSYPLPWWYLPAFVPLIVAVSVLFTWVYNSTGGSLFAAVVLHGAINTALDLRAARAEGVAEREDVVALVFFTALAVGLVWRYGATNLSRRDRVVVAGPIPDGSSA